MLPTRRIQGTLRALMSRFGELRWEGTSTDARKGHCRLHFLDSLETMRIMDPRSLRPCLAVGANQAEQNEATDRFSKKCEPLLGLESILGFVECEFVGMGS